MSKAEFLKVLETVEVNITEVLGNFVIEVVDEDDWYNVKRALEKKAVK